MRTALVIQTAFAGDTVLTLPLVQHLHARGAAVDVLCTPETAPLLRGHPSIRAAIAFDKRGGASTAALGRVLRRAKYEAVFSPHRSHRSALLAYATGAPIRISYTRSGFSFLYTHRVSYDASAHETARVLALLEPLGGDIDAGMRPDLHPSEDDVAHARAVTAGFGGKPYVCFAPGSVWETKRWTSRGFRAAIADLAGGYACVLIGGEADRALCEDVRAPFAARADVANAAGSLSWLATAAIIRDARLLVSNDSAPVHVASAMGTPVVEIFGATTPDFGFTPFGVEHRIVLLDGVACRPCGSHGGHRCPIGTFVCMEGLDAAAVIGAARSLLGDERAPGETDP